MGTSEERDIILKKIRIEKNNEKIEYFSDNQHAYKMRTKREFIEIFMN